MHFEKEVQCPECKWLLCPHCGGCFCGLNEEGKRVAEAMEAQMRLNFNLPILTDE